jgi:hypothetical protein
MLWLKRNPLRPAGASWLAKLLSTNRLIHTLDLDNTGLLDEGATTVVHALRHNGGTLRHLYLNSNGLGLPTAKVGMMRERGRGSERERTMERERGRDSEGEQGQRQRERKGELQNNGL